MSLLQDRTRVLENLDNFRKILQKHYLFKKSLKALSGIDKYGVLKNTNVTSLIKGKKIFYTLL